MLKLMLISKYISIFLFSEPLNYSLLLIENYEEGQGESIDYLLNLQTTSWSWNKYKIQIEAPTPPRYIQTHSISLKQTQLLDLN